MSWGTREQIIPVSDTRGMGRKPYKFLERVQQTEKDGVRGWVGAGETYPFQETG